MLRYPRHQRDVKSLKGYCVSLTMEERQNILAEPKGLLQIEVQISPSFNEASLTL